MAAGGVPVAVMNREKEKTAIFLKGITDAPYRAECIAVNNSDRTANLLTAQTGYSVL